MTSGMVSCERSKSSSCIKVEGGDSEDGKDEKDGSVFVELSAEYCCSSTAVPAPPSNRSLEEFLVSKEVGQLLFTGVKKSEVVELEEVGEELMAAYREECELLSARPPSGQDRFFRVSSGAMNFPGLRVYSLVTLATKLVKPSSEFPFLETVLLKSEPKATGARLFVWLFHKVAKSSKARLTHSLHRLRPLPAPDAQITFQVHDYFHQKIHISPLLLSLIPGGKDRVQQSGNDAVQDFLDKDIPFALDRFQKAYLDYIR